MHIYTLKKGKVLIKIGFYIFVFYKKRGEICMCGIIGYIGDKPAAPFLINGLKKLEYRGYDSSGVAILQESSLKVSKFKGRISALEEKIKGSQLTGNVGIGHTRWATHGEPNNVNSHPHLSRSGKIAVVHNGIIENYIELKEFLETKGYNFVSETDTEVIAHLIEYNYKGDLVHAVVDSIKKLEGSYALGVICSDDPDEFIAVRKDSPLIVGVGKGENYIASDIPAILEYTRDIYILEDREAAIIKKDEIRIFNIDGVKVEKNIFHVDWDIGAAEKGGYEHFMMKEICEEPLAVRNTISPRIKNGKVCLGSIKITAEYLKDIKKIYIVACGTAYHAGVMGKYIIEKLARIPVEVDMASEFRYRDPLISEQDLVIVISQSGETLDTLMALKESKKRGARVLAIVNVMGSSIARASDDVLYTWAGPEISVASTKAYNTQLAAVYLLALDIATKKGTIDETYCKKIIDTMKKIPEEIEKIISKREVIKEYAKNFCEAKSIFFMGRGLDYALSMEGSLKLKEISYIQSESYAGGELKHGTIALIEKGTLVICPITQENLTDKMISNIKEVKARGAVILAITNEKNLDVLKVADMVIPIPDIDPLVAPIAAVTTMQLFAYYMAVARGCDVDKPRNLAKSVTVE
jgi:glutamine---fructose-6-phosphate transaminase (isomerizing)